MKTEQTAEPAPAPRVTDAQLRDLWRKAGGDFHGPNIEHGIMSERKLLPFLRMLIEGKVVP